MSDMSTPALPTGHSHVFLGKGHEQAERRTWWVILLCTIVMAGNIVGGLAKFSNAVVLAMIALPIGCETLDRLFHPVPIQFNEAIPIACLGLAVNVAGMWLLSGEHTVSSGRTTRQYSA